MSKLLTRREVAKILHCSPSTLDRLRAFGLLEPSTYRPAKKRPTPLWYESVVEDFKKRMANRRRAIVGQGEQQPVLRPFDRAG